MDEYYGNNDYRDYLIHYGVKGMKWGIHKRAKDYVVNRLEARKQEKAREKQNERYKDLIDMYEKNGRIIGRDKNLEKKRRFVEDPFQRHILSSDTVKKAENTIKQYDRFKEKVENYERGKATSEHDQEVGKKRTKEYRKRMKRR